MGTVIKQSDLSPKHWLVRFHKYGKIFYCKESVLFFGIDEKPFYHVEGTCCLEAKEKLFENFFIEMYLNGTILECTFDKFHIPNDTDSDKNIVLKSNNTASENRHWAKILSSIVQVKARHELINIKFYLIEVIKMC